MRNGCEENTPYRESERFILSQTKTNDANKVMKVKDDQKSACILKDREKTTRIKPRTMLC